MSIIVTQANTKEMYSTLYLYASQTSKSSSQSLDKNNTIIHAKP